MHVHEGEDYAKRLQLVSDIVTLVSQPGDSNVFGKSPWVYCRGYLDDKEVHKLSVVVSRQLAEVANEKEWGADSEEFWSTRPIYFSTNLDTDGLQWARQVRHVFAEASERMNWAHQFRARTQHLEGGTKDKVTPLMYSSHILIYIHHTLGDQVVLQASDMSCMW